MLASEEHNNVQGVAQQWESSQGRLNGAEGGQVTNSRKGQIDGEMLGGARKEMNEKNNGDDNVERGWKRKRKSAASED